MRVSASSLKCSTQPVRTRLSRIVSAMEASRRFAPRASFWMTCGLLLLTPTLVCAAGAQIGARPQFTADAAPQVLCQTQVVGNRRIPKESILARLFSRPGDQYDPAVVERDFNSMWNTGYFDNVRIESVPGQGCLQLIVYVQEKPTIRDITYVGLNAITVSDVLERYKKDKISFSIESQYDPTVVKRAEVTLQQMLGEHGHQFAVIRLEVKTIPPAGSRCDRCARA
jgi:outer membrane protein insertion porin family